MAEMGSASRYASFVVGAIFLLSGVVKLFNINNDVHKHMSNDFKIFATVFPLRPLGIKPSPSLYMKTIGVAEIIGGILLILGSPRLKKLAAVVLLVIMMGAMQTLFALKRYTEVVFPFSHFLILIWILSSYNWDKKGIKTD